VSEEKQEPTVTRKAGRPAKKQEEDVVSKILSEEVEQVNEKAEEIEDKVEDKTSKVEPEELIQAMAKQMADMKAEMERLKESSVQKVVIAPPKPKQKHVCCEIKCSFDEMERARRVMFNQIKDTDNSVTLRCPVSGVSIRYKDLNEFPRDDQRIYSAGVDGYFVKYTII